MFWKKHFTGKIPGACYSAVMKLLFLRSKALERCFIESEPLPFSVPHSSLLWNLIEHCGLSHTLFVKQFYCKNWGLFHEMLSLWNALTEIVLHLFIYEIEGKMSWLTYSIPKAFVTKVEMNENDWVCRPGLQIWKTAGDCWVWNGFNLQHGFRPTTHLLLVNFYRRERHTESNSFQKDCSWN